MADFAARGFRLDRPAERAELEGHARSFLRGFNTAARAWRDPHEALRTLPASEQGFGYEGAAMHAALRDLVTGGRARALARLLDGAGDEYVHLVHVGYGWALVPPGAALRVPLPVPLPPTPLLRWLALDGAGFAETYFGGVAALHRRARRGHGHRWEARVAGCGRALWFAESAHVPGVAAVIADAPAAARPHLWSGIGLASCYAGCAGPERLDDLLGAAGAAGDHLRQGAMFAVAARHRSGIVPPHTGVASMHLFGTTPAEVAGWTDDAADGLTGTTDAHVFTEWKTRLRARVAATAAVRP